MNFITAPKNHSIFVQLKIVASFVFKNVKCKMLSEQQYNINVTQM